MPRPRKPAPNANEMQSIADELRDLKNWLAVFAKEYGLAQEAEDALHQKLDRLGDKLALLGCK